MSPSTPHLSSVVPPVPGCDNGSTTPNSREGPTGQLTLFPAGPAPTPDTSVPSDVENLGEMETMFHQVESLFDGLEGEELRRTASSLFFDHEGNPRVRRLAAVAY